MVQKGIAQNIFFAQISKLIESARHQAYRSVNFIMVETYWNIGRRIVEEEQKGKRRAGYGEKLIKELAQRLTEEFGKGFEASNLWKMRHFYLTFPILDSLRLELSWTHYRLLLRVENENARKYYLREAAVYHWSTRQLERQINSFYYERILASKNKTKLQEETNSLEKTLTPEDLIKDPFVLEFLNVKENTLLRENQLESLLIQKLQQFLLELGKGFSFIAQQYRISAGADHFYVDLVFYNYLLKCFVLIELKTHKLTHQDIGQMDFYVRYFEDQVCNKDDIPTIGIILCSEKNETIVKYSMLAESKQLFASKYKLILPSEDELKKELTRERDLLEKEKFFTERNS